MKVAYQKATSKEEAYKLACDQITEEYIEKFKVHAEIHYNEIVGEIKATGKGFTLTLSFGESDVGVDLDVSFMLRPLKGKVLETIENKIKKTV